MRYMIGGLYGAALLLASTAVHAAIPSLDAGSMLGYTPDYTIIRLVMGVTGLAFLALAAWAFVTRRGRQHPVSGRVGSLFVSVLYLFAAALMS